MWQEEKGTHVLSERPGLRTALYDMQYVVERFARVSVEQRLKNERGSDIRAFSDLVAFYQMALDVPEAVKLLQGDGSASRMIRLSMPISVFEKRGVVFGLRRGGLSTGIDVCTVKIGDSDEENEQKERGIAIDKTWQVSRRGMKREPDFQVSSLTFSGGEVFKNYLGKGDFPVSSYDRLREQLRKTWQRLSRVPVVSRREFSYSLMPSVFVAR